MMRDFMKELFDGIIVFAVINGMILLVIQLIERLSEKVQ